MDGKLTPNQLTINKLKENQLKGVSGEQPAPFGRYKNLFLSESEYAELKREYPDRLERFIEELSEFIAAYGKVYANHAAAVRMWARRDRKDTGKKGIPDYSGWEELKSDYNLGNDGGVEVSLSAGESYFIRVTQYNGCGNYILTAERQYK